MHVQLAGGDNDCRVGSNQTRSLLLHAGQWLFECSKTRLGMCSGIWCGHSIYCLAAK